MSNHTPENFTLATSAETRTSIGKEAAVELCKSGWWEGKTPREITAFQLSTDELCLPFDKLHEAVEKALNRPVYTHEFGINWDGMLAELNGIKETPTTADVLQQLVDTVGAEKVAIITT